VPAQKVTRSILERAAPQLWKPFEDDSRRFAQRVRVNGLDDPDRHVRAARTDCATWPHSSVARSERAGSCPG